MYSSFVAVQLASGTLVCGRAHCVNVHIFGVRSASLFPKDISYMYECFFDRCVRVSDLFVCGVWCVVPLRAVLGTCR